MSDGEPLVTSTSSDSDEPPTPKRRTRRRRTWTQRALLLAGLLVAIGCFGAAKIFWDARAVLADLPRIRVGPNVLAQEGEPGEPLNFLLVGVDSSEGLDPNDPVRDGRDVVAEANGRFLSDTILLMRLDPATGDAAVLSIPRDLYVDVPGSSSWKINSTLLIGGMDKLIETINTNLDVPVTHFVMVDFAGFSELVELVGGVPVYFPYPTRDQGSGLNIVERGCWILDGPQALGYVRARTIEELIDGTWTPLTTPAPDLARIERQQEFMVLALEEALAAGGADLTRIREFVEIGTQAVQLDETLTAGDMLDLAEAFRDYDTESLRVATLPVEPLFSDDGGYLGEQLQILEASEILDVFQGEADGVRPADVVVVVRSDDDGQRERSVDQLVTRGFDAAESPGAGNGSTPNATTVRFAPQATEDVVILARYLERTPNFVVDSELAEGDNPRTVIVDIGVDFAGVRSFPRPDADVRTQVVRAREAATQSADSDAPETTESESGTGENSTPPDSSATSDVPKDTTSIISGSSSSVVARSADDPENVTGPASTLVRGRPPENVRCVSSGG